MMFDLKKNLIYRMPSGSKYKARVLGTITSDPFNTVVAIDWGPTETVERFNDRGEALAGLGRLVNEVEKRSSFTNVYPTGPGGTFESRAGADKMAARRSTMGLTRIGLLEYLYEDDQIVDVIFHKISGENCD